MYKNKEMNKLGRTLSYILRHGALENNLNIDDEGYVKIKNILKLHEFRHVSTHDMKNIVKKDKKNRYTISHDGNYIKANQGHSIKIKNLSLKLITNYNLYPTVIHGTTYDNWIKIDKSGGLNKMNRNHIHMAMGNPGEAKSGIRHNSLILIYIDLKKAINDGIKFYRSENDVILTEGVDGILSKEYFTKIVNRKTSEVL